MTIGPYVTIGPHVTIEKNPLYIIGSRHIFYYAGDDKIRIGCYIYPFAWWIKNGRDLAQKEDYTADQLEEYKSYLELAANLLKWEIPAGNLKGGRNELETA